MKISVSILSGLLLLGGLVGAAPWGAAAQGGAPAGAPPLVTQDFEDVPTNSPFYTYIHNLFVDGVVGGYACGGPGEPCVPPGNLPYFRPGANVTRGQNAKFTDNGRRVLTGAHSGTFPNYGLFSALDTDRSSSLNAGVYGQGATGILGESYTTGTATGSGGYFYNNGGSTGQQYGAYAYTLTGWGLYGVSAGSTTGQSSAGVVGQSTLDGGAGGVFTATTASGSAGLVATGFSGAMLAGHGTTVTASGDGLDVAAMGGLSDAIYSLQPTGTTNYTLYGQAHIHGSNISAADYESEVVYDGAAPLALGSVVALDPANVRGGPLGVLPADASTADAAIGVLSYRLRTVPVNGVAKTAIDAAATAVQPGDRAYITILGRVAMALPAGAKVGTRLAVGADGAVGVAAAGGVSFGRVASRPDATGRGDVLVNFK
ncbi:MAG TPA: S-layer homology domain-containing protein [Chloroflexia bacterium]|nr:S-layer homology domain-containing protein [Chloroflexia bacterium]